MLIRHPLCVCLIIILPVCRTIQPFPRHVCIKKNALQPLSQNSSNLTVSQVFQIGLCGVIEADLELFCNSWSGGILRERRYSSTLLMKATSGVKEGTITVAASPLSPPSATIGEGIVIGFFSASFSPPPPSERMLLQGRGPAPQFTSPTRGRTPPDEQTGASTGPPRPHPQVPHRGPSPLAHSPCSSQPLRPTPTSALGAVRRPWRHGRHSPAHAPGATRRHGRPKFRLLNRGAGRRRASAPKSTACAAAVLRCGIHPPWCLPPSSRTASRGGSPSPVGCEGMPATHRRAGLRPVACRPIPCGPRSVPIQSGAFAVARCR